MALGSTVAAAVLCLALGIYLAPHWHEFVANNNHLLGSNVPNSTDIYLVTSGDLRLSANQKCWETQNNMNEEIIAALKKLGFNVIRAHDYNPEEKHGFISSQRMGMDVFKKIPKRARLIVAEAVWQYSHHVLAGLRDHEGPILVLANWSGEWPGLVGALNLGGSLTKMNKPYSILWSEKFDDSFFNEKIREWLKNGRIQHDLSHVHSTFVVPSEFKKNGRTLANNLRREKAIIGIFDEGCMGMYNAIIDDELLNPLGIYKERLSQSALVARMKTVTNEEAEQAYTWLIRKGLNFRFGEDPKVSLTKDQVIEQLKMYIAAVRIAYEFGCESIGIQYQQGLKDTTVASDLVEGILNNPDRPPVVNEFGVELYKGEALPHFNEVDEGAAVDIIVTARVWKSLGLDPSTTLHDLRWGEWFKGNGIDAFVWVFEISGAAPASHFEHGYRSASSERQPPMYFPLGGGTLKGNSKPGIVVISRVYIFRNTLHADVGVADVVSLPMAEMERRWNKTTPQWPIMSAVVRGVTRDQMMARHKANHIQVVYVDPKNLREALWTKVAMFQELGITTHLIGDANKI